MSSTLELARQHYKKTDEICRVGELLFPGYMEKHKHKSYRITSLASCVRRDECERWGQTFNAYRGRNPSLKVESRKGSGPLIPERRGSKKIGYNAKIYKRRACEYIKDNTGIEMPFGIPAIIFEEAMNTLGL